MERQDWAPQSWRDYPAQQMPTYPDAAALQRAEDDLRVAAPLVAIKDCLALRDDLARITDGGGFLLQAGDCAERLLPHHDGTFDESWNLAQDVAAAIAAPLRRPVTLTVRAAGQFAKPRSQNTEKRGSVTLPAYRGDAINGYDFSGTERTPDPARMIRAHEHAARTLRVMPKAMLTCHEALLLPYEQGLTRQCADTGQYYASSAHFLWLGARTQDPRGAHVEYLRGIANPLGIKCAPWTDADTLRRLCDVLNPHNERGRITLIARMGCTNIDDCLPPLIAAMKNDGRHVLWVCDPMHGNTITTENDIKTRRVSDIIAEITRFFAIHDSCGTYAGGVHLELTRRDVTECIGADVADHAALSGHYETLCDPRLNPAQAMMVADAIVHLCGVDSANDPIPAAGI